MKELRKEQKSAELISHHTLLRLTGILGIALPVILATGAIIFGECTEIQSSISLYYYTGMQNIFVGVMSVEAALFYVYKGYDRQDYIISNIIAISALGIAYFPTDIEPHAISSCITCSFTNSFSYFHTLFSVLFFGSFVYFLIFLFTKTSGKLTKPKLQRNRLYKICGSIMIVNLLLIILYDNFGRDKFPAMEAYHPVFWLETISLWAFGTSWLVKGEVFLRD